MIKLPKVLPAPKRPEHLAHYAKWLSGEGAGSWFVIDNSSKKNQLTISRYSPKGILECSGEFLSNLEFDPHGKYQIGYPSHCQKVTVVQDNKHIHLRRI